MLVEEQWKANSLLSHILLQHLPCFAGPHLFDNGK